MSLATHFETCESGARSLRNGDWRETIGLCYRLPSIDPPRTLTVCERKIVWGLLGGCTNQQLALRNGVSSRTIAVQLQQMYDKVNVSSRHELLATLLASSGDNLNPAHLATRARVAPGASQVFAGERLLEGSSAALEQPEAWAPWLDTQEVWGRMLAGELGLVSTRALGDLRFLVLTPQARLDEKRAREACVHPWDLSLLKGLGSGHSNQHLARELNLSQPAISIWSRRVLAKLGLTHRAELMRLLSEVPPTVVTS